MKDLVLSLQKLPMGGADFTDLTSSNSNICSSASDGGCQVTGADGTSLF